MAPAVTDLGLAFVAGMLTVAAPCILPVLPILLAGAVGSANRSRPVWIVLGFVAAFSVVALALGRVTTGAGLASSLIRDGAAALLGASGLGMLWPAPYERAMARLGGLFGRVDRLAAATGPGNLGGLVLGATLGVLWTPCAGPVLASILALVVSAEDAPRATVLLVAYAIGAGIPMLAIAYGGQRVTVRVRRLAPYAVGLQRGFGVLVIATAIAMYAEWDAALAARLVSPFDAATGSEAVRLVDEGPAPELVGLETWLNADSLTLRALRGRVVLVDFWTYACVNCVRTLPHVVAWYERYRDQGFVVLGIHTPEFPAERLTANVRAALERHGITYPVAQDNAYATWKAYENHDWPAQYLIDRRGRIVARHVGEGGYDAMEEAIRTVLHGDRPSVDD